MHKPFFRRAPVLFSALFAAAFLALPPQAAAEETAAGRLSFPIAGLLTLEESQVQADWDEGWFGAAPATSYNHGIARIACILSAVAYTDVQPESREDALSRCYRALGVPDPAVEYHYTIDYADPFWGNDQCAFSFASKEIQTARGKRTLVFAVIRGTPLSANEWVSNLDIGAESNGPVAMHTGFSRATQQVLTAFYAYLLDKHIDVSRACFLITGHSRGAAVANLMGSILIQNRLFKAEDLYVYTFASPNVTTDEAAGSERYRFIWNIVNTEDIVPTVPLARDRWQYRKYGSTKALIYAGNDQSGRYEGDYLPRVNAYYRSFLGRDYRPFRLGPFVPVQLTRFLASMNSTVAKYYRRGLGLHNKAESILWKVFPAGDDERGAGPAGSGEKKSSFVMNALNAVTGGLLDYAALAATDMHANEAYLAWMLALDEEELFSDRGSSELVLSGSYQAAVFAKDGSVLARILDNRIVYRSLRLPAAAFQLSPQALVLGLPSNEDFTVVLYHSSFFPTPVSVRLEHYDAGGVLQSVEEKKHVFLHKGMALLFSAGKTSLAQQQVEPDKIRGAQARHYIQTADLSSLWDFKLLFETSINSNWLLSGGLHVGTESVYGSALISHRSNGMDDTLQATAGIGTQQTLWGALLMNIDGQCHFVQDFDTSYSDDDTSGFCFVPSLRLTLALKPRRRLQFFGALCYDFNIDGFNDRAFDNALRKNTDHALELSSSVRMVPSLQFGIKF